MPLAMACLACSVCLTAGPAIRILETGEGHGDEINARSGEQWVALAPVKDGLAWRKGTITVRRVADAVLDDGVAMTGKAVGFPGPTPLFLLRGWDLPLGRVQTLFTAPEENSLRMARAIGDSPLTLNLNGARYRLRVTHRRADVEQTPSQPTELVLERGAERQILYSWPGGLVDQFCDLVWAGDLDGDGKLDLYLYLSDHYNVIEHTLFRSRGAARGKLVTPVAKWVTTGC